MSEAPTILVADDEAGMRESVSRALRREAFHVVTVEDGAAALDVLRRSSVNLLIADLRMHGFTPEALAKLVDYPWPGNVRELEDAVERRVILARGRCLGLGDLPEAIGRAEPSARVIPIALGMPLEEVEQLLIKETLRRTQGDKELAAKLLGIASRTVYRKLKERQAQQADGESVEERTGV